MSNQTKNHVKKFTILIAEDDQAISEVMGIILEEEGYVVKVMVNPEEIVSTIAKGGIDLLFLDVWLGNNNGADVCRQLKSDDKTKDTPVIMLSASVNIESIAASVGADEVLQKPFDISVLIDLVKKYESR